MIPVEGFEAFTFEAEGFSKPVYRRGEGPAVVLIHELPGMMPECVDLGRRIADRGGRGVGAIGMCFTGRFALSMMMDAPLIAPVLSQPSSSWSRAAMGIPAPEWDNAVKRSREENIPVLGLRFEGDPLCRRERFETMKEGFGERFREVVVAGDKHSVLTLNFNDMTEADRARVWGELTRFLDERLR